MGCPPTLAQCNEVRVQNRQRLSTPSTYDKEIQKWNRVHSISHSSEYAKSITSIGDEESDDAVSAEVEKKVQDIIQEGFQVILVRVPRGRN